MHAQQQPNSQHHAEFLLANGIKLVNLHDMSKRPVGDDWNDPANFVGRIDHARTGYGMPLAANGLCSVDPDDYKLAKIGVAALGYDLDEWMAAGVRTQSTRKGSGGRSTFLSEPDLPWVKFSVKLEDGTTKIALELRANSPNLQDVVPGCRYRDKAGNECSQQYADKAKTFADAEPLPDDLFDFWNRCAEDGAFLREQQTIFASAISKHVKQPVGAVLSLSQGRKGGAALPFTVPSVTQSFNLTHKVEEILSRHPYEWHARLDRWSRIGSEGAPAIRPIPDKDDLWQSDHGSDPLCGTFDAWTAYVVLDHNYNTKAAVDAFLGTHKDGLDRLTDALPKIEQAPAPVIPDIDTTLGKPTEVDQPAVVIAALARIFGQRDVGEVAGEIAYRPTIVRDIYEAMAWNPQQSRFTVMKEGLKSCAAPDAQLFINALFPRFFDPVKLEDYARETLGDDADEKQVNKLIGAANAAAYRKLSDLIKVHRQFQTIDMSSDPFSTVDKVSVADNIATLSFAHRPFITGGIDQMLVDDYKEHFPQFDAFLDLIVAARFATDRKKAYLWVQAVSDWGKSFFVGILAEQGLVVDTTAESLSKIMGGSPIGMTMKDFLRAWVLSVDEFKGVTREMKMLTDSLSFSPKNQPTVKAPLYLKVFMSAEDVPSLANPETGVEDQFGNRFSHFRADTILNDRPLFVADKGRYRKTLINYVGRELNARVAQYVAMGRDDAAKRADDAVIEFYEAYRIDRHFGRLSDLLPDLVNSFVDWVMGIVEKGDNDLRCIGGGRPMLPRAEQDIYDATEKCSKTGLTFLKTGNTIIESWMAQEFTVSQGGKLKYKTSQIVEMLGGVRKCRINRQQQRWLLIANVDDEGKLPESTQALLTASRHKAKEGF